LQRDGDNSVKQNVSLEHVREYFLDEQWGLVDIFECIIGFVQEFLDLESEVNKLKDSAQVIGVREVEFPSLVVDELIGKSLINVGFLFDVQVIRANELLKAFI
jgi:hypothetical protein